MGMPVSRVCHQSHWTISVFGAFNTLVGKGCFKTFQRKLNGWIWGIEAIQPGSSWHLVSQSPCCSVQWRERQASKFPLQYCWSCHTCYRAELGHQLTTWLAEPCIYLAWDLTTLLVTLVPSVGSLRLATSETHNNILETNQIITWLKSNLVSSPLKLQPFWAAET